MASVLYHNGTILTQANEHSEASAMLTENGHFVAVGTRREMEKYNADDTVDLKGNCVVPGFNDAHIHVWKVGQLESFIIDLRGIKSITEIQQSVRQQADSLPAGTWIVGRGFNESSLAERRLPTKEDLDVVTTRHPIYLIRTCAHIAVVNSVALQKAQVTSSSLAPDGGVIGKTNAGELTGIFYETALGLVANHIPTPTRGDYKQMIKLGAQKLLRVGVTSATDPAVHPELLEAYYELYHEGNLPIRMNLMPILLPDGGNKPYPIPPKFQSDWLTVDTVKFFSDGGLSGKTAAVKRPYKNSSNTGVLRLQREIFLSLASAAQASGFRIGTHAIGDRAIDLVIDVYKELHKKFGSTRNRIEHLGLPSDENILDIAQHGFVPVPQPIFLNELGENFIQSLDDEYLRRCYPVRSLLDQHIPVAFSTDAPVVGNLNPWSGINAAITRQTAKGNLISKSESITLSEALHAYTMGGAYAERNETHKGSIEKGKLADFVVLDKNPLATNIDQLHSIKVVSTYVNGVRVYSDR